MSYDLVAVGGTGAQFAHLVLDLATVGLLAPPRQVLVLDSDTTYFEGSLRKSWQALLATLKASNDQRVSLDFVRPYLGLDAEYTLRNIADIRMAEPLERLLLGDRELSTPLRHGLYCLPKLGGIITAYQASSQQAGLFPSNIIRALEESTSTEVVVAGSLVGGMGAGFMPPLVRLMRTTKSLDGRRISCAALLPWFKLPTKTTADGPSNQRMRLNAASGLRHLAEIIASSDILRDSVEATRALVLGAPDLDKVPLRESPNQTSKPGSLLLMAVSYLLSRRDIFDGIRSTDGTRSGLFAASGHAAGTPLSGRVRFSLQSRSGAGPSVGAECIPALLTSTSEMIAGISEASRFERAYQGPLRNPSYIPRRLYDLIGTALAPSERGPFAIAFSAALAARARELREIAERFRALLSESDGSVLPPPVTRPALSSAVAAFQAGASSLAESLTDQSEDLPALVAAVSAKDPFAALGLIEAALARQVAGGFAQSIGAPTVTAEVLLLSGAPRMARTGDHLVEVLGSQTRSLVERTLIENLQRDSLSIASPLARGYVVEVEAQRKAEPQSLATSTSGRLVLLALGVIARDLEFSRYLEINKPSVSRTAFVNAIATHEQSVEGNFRFGAIMAIVTQSAAFAEFSGVDVGTPLATTSRTSMFIDSVRAAEVNDSPEKSAFEALERRIRARADVSELAWLLGRFLSDLAQDDPTIAEQPWHAMLTSWTQDEPQAEPAAWLYGAGPVYIASGRDRDQKRRGTTSCWLPLLLAEGERERLVIAFAEMIAAGRVRPAELAAEHVVTGMGGILATFRGIPAPKDSYSLEEAADAGAFYLALPTPDRGKFGADTERYREAVARIWDALAREQRVAKPVLGVPECLRLLAECAEFSSLTGIDVLRAKPVWTRPIGIRSPLLANLVPLIARADQDRPALVSSPDFDAQGVVRGTVHFSQRAAKWYVSGRTTDEKEREVLLQPISGILLGDPRSKEKPRAVIWRFGGQPERGPRVEVNGDVGGKKSPAFYEGSIPSSNLRPLDLPVATGDGVGLTVTFFGGEWTALNLADIFSPSIPEFGDHSGRFSYPDLPILAEYLSLVESVEPPQVKVGTGGLEHVRYSIRVRGLAATLKVTYGGQQVVRLGVPDINLNAPASPSDYFHAVVWPDSRRSSWRHFVVDVGMGDRDEWCRDWVWSVHSEDTVKVPHVDCAVLHAAPSSAPASRASARESALDGISGRVARIASTERPLYLSVRRTTDGASGVLKLLEPLSPRSAATGRTAEVAVDFGTTKTSAVYRLSHPGGDPSRSVRMDFSCATEQPIPGQSVLRSIAVSRIGTFSRLRPVQPWLTGVGSRLSQGSKHQPVFAVPTVGVLVGDPSSDPNEPEEERVKSLVPMVSIATPSPDYYDAYRSIAHSRPHYEDLKWRTERDPIYQEVFVQFAANILVLIAARLDADALSVRVSVPLKFTAGYRLKYTELLNRAATIAAQLAGCEINVTVYIDEARPIAFSFARSIPPAPGVRLVCICDIGGGTVDVSVAAMPTDDTTVSPGSLTTLTSGSIRFGADLLLNLVARKNWLATGQTLLSEPSNQGRISNRVGPRVQIMERGYHAYLERFSAAERTHICSLFRLYFLLVEDYLARHIAAAIRNPHKLASFVYRMRNNRLPEGVSERELLTALGGELAICPVDLRIMCAGNGWLALSALDSQGQDVRTGNANGFVPFQIGRRVTDLLRGRRPIDPVHFFHDPDRLAHVTPTTRIAFPSAPDPSGNRGNEALASCLISYPTSSDAAAYLLSLMVPNGLTEEYDGGQTAGESSRRWFDFPLGPGFTWGLPPGHQTLTPPAPRLPMPGHIGRVSASDSGSIADLTYVTAKALGVNLESFDAIVNAARLEMNDLVAPAAATARTRSLIDVVYEGSFAKIFDPEWEA